MSERTTSTGQSRRDFLAALGATAAAGALLSTPGVAWALPNQLSEGDARFTARMLRDIPLGEPFYDDWYLLDAYPPAAGGITVVVAKGMNGEPMRVDIVRREDPVRAPAATDHLELYVMDGGKGIRVLPHDLRRALRVLADRLADDEAQARLADQLLTHSQRLSHYEDFMERAAGELQPVPPR